MTTETGKAPSPSNRGQRAPVDAMIRRAAGEPTDSGALFEPYRHELLLHCYRLMGSLHDAEDSVQETMLRAWQNYGAFRGDASLRTWLYTIATNTCLNALKKRKARTLPLVAIPEGNQGLPPTPATAEIHWLEPFPDSWLAEATDNPETRYTQREAVSLAFLTALQLLPPRQRAVLLLADVLDWRASEVAKLLEMSVSAVNSALFRARTTLEKHYHPDAQEQTQKDTLDAETKALLVRYVQAWETDDIAGLIALLKEDATFSMPPFPSWFQGYEAIRDIFFFSRKQPPFFSDGSMRQWRLIPTHANGQAAFACYRADQSGWFHAYGIHVLTFDEADSSTDRITDLLIFSNPALVGLFGFPLDLPEEIA